MITWRKSSHSGSGGRGGQECVELAQLDTAIGVRDSKRPDGGHLSLDSATFRALLTAVRSGRYDN